MSSTLPPSAEHKISRISVLIVDDDAALLETTAALLDEDFEVRTAPKGSAALAILESRRYDVVCADYDMPGLDGITLLRRVHDLCPGTSGILVTGLREQLPRGFAGDESIFAVVYKPYTPDALFKAIRDASKVAAMTLAAASFGRSSKRLRRK